MIRRIADEAALAEGTRALVACELRFGPAIALGLPLRPRPNDFGELFSVIVHQQVSLASAQAVWRRLEAAGLVSEGAVAGASDADLGLAGLTRPKQRAARALAAARLDYAALDALPDAQALATLQAIKGIGPWTAGVYVMFALRRADLLPAADIALQEGARRLFDLPARPDAQRLAAMAEPWAPWRSVAARALWVYTLHQTGRETVW